MEPEGDRAYIAPEILLGVYGKPADIFSFGLVMLESLLGVEIPENGPAWRELRRENGGAGSSVSLDSFLASAESGMRSGCISPPEPQGTRDAMRADEADARNTMLHLVTRRMLEPDPVKRITARELVAESHRLRMAFSS